MFNYRYRPYLPPPFPGYPCRPYPSVEVTRFQDSASTCMHLMNDGQTILKKVRQDAQFAHELKDAAQKNDHSHVQELIKGTGIQSSFHIAYTPDAIRIDLMAGNEDDCSELTMKLCW
ncbi:hypothetical protein ABFG93_07940 [Pseudalkalibacillus hwajinpoensis]|uniref:hypothetical protein n=1 Tax=Guptibacillus hwajinpoensis TaxID=208199 RepID=UPI00325AAC36